MKKYLEYKDEKSHKFWEIVLNGNMFTIRYGKVETDGQVKTKELESDEKAEKEFTKLVKQKVKKGYVEIDDSIDIETQVELFTYNDFKKKNKLGLLPESSNIVKFSNEMNTPKMINNTLEGESLVAFIKDDIVFENNLHIDQFFSNIDSRVSIIWFEGGVEVKGTMYASELEDYSTAVVFEKPVKAKNMIIGGTTLAFLDDIEVTQIFYTQIQSEGWTSFDKNSKKSFTIIVDNNQIWKKDNIVCDFGGMSEELTPENLDKFFINKDYFFVVDEDYESEDEEDDKVIYFDLEEDGVLVAAILSGKKIFNIE